MSSSSMRAIARAYLLNPPLPGLSEIKPGWDNQMELVAAGGMVPDQSVAALHIVSETEQRVSVPAVLGIRMVHYVLELQICYMVDGDSEEIVGGVDRLVESVKARLRADPRMGQVASAVFEAAQGPGAQITVQRGDVQYVNTGLANSLASQWVAVRWTATEEIQA